MESSIPLTHEVSRRKQNNMPRIRFHLLGLIVLFLNKIRYTIRGYREPRPFASTEYQRAIEYDEQVVTQWLEALKDYTGQTVKDKVVLELGPGADLGPALFLLDRGAKRYMTVDANRLIDQTPLRFYDRLLKQLPHAQEIRPELEKTLAGNDDRIAYIVDPTFNLRTAVTEPVDIVVSQAAFEHFSDIDNTIEQLSAVVKSGGVLIAEVDLMTHSGMLRSRDPLNIYRYSDVLYRLARFTGIPNRIRPHTYKETFERHGWYNVEVIPLQTLPRSDVEQLRMQLAQRFRHEHADMHILTMLIRATKH